jgi:hypothetical protein
MKLLLIGITMILAQPNEIEIFNFSDETDLQDLDQVTPAALSSRLLQYPVNTRFINKISL